MRRHIRILTAILASALALFCAPGMAGDGKRIRLAYADWSSSTASTHLMCALIRERLGTPCKPVLVDAERMWRQVAEGEADAMLSAWLPDTHASYLARFGERVEDLGPNLEGTRTGLVVPEVRAGRQTGGLGMRTRSYLDAESIADLPRFEQELGGRIVGIDPEAGIMEATERALEVYDLRGFRLIDGSESSMTRALERAIQRQEPILVAGWTPHWMFGRWSLRFLEDPKGVYGGRGNIHTMARLGLESDHPQVHALLDRFHWTPEDMSTLMVWIEQDPASDPYAQAVRWIKTHPTLVERWLD
ncbi:glycine betaine ABC transporter substrate-binding protein [Imhoffiella purpurea]|uniref:Glycine betaine ABC transport system, glycine betaine-binding protein OpuAC n=1 Tax=Imhoffiella purpurea TaxID=1249627 RepID=W9VBV0_9GAMM|nr:glycine betaine ABC transporter substrate-binding protein [Imhoffiella purpurea]EXJ14446.1 Glycine betaine ABC transport system, glycine betaine-binding protein OpuAC [Imhoffiella purpurea]